MVKKFVDKIVFVDKKFVSIFGIALVQFTFLSCPVHAGEETSITYSLLEHHLSKLNCSSNSSTCEACYNKLLLVKRVT